MFNAEDDLLLQIQDTERLLNEGDRRIKAMINSLPGPAYAINYHGRYVYANHQFAALKNTTAEALIADGVPCDHCPVGTLDEIQKFMDKGEASIMQTNIIEDSVGSSRPYLSYQIPMAAAGGEKVLMVLSIEHSMLPSEGHGLDLHPMGGDSDVVSRARPVDVGVKSLGLADKQLGSGKNDAEARDKAATGGSKRPRTM